MNYKFSKPGDTLASVDKEIAETIATHKHVEDGPRGKLLCADCSAEGLSIGAFTCDGYQELVDECTSIKAPAGSTTDRGY